MDAMRYAITDDLWTAMEPLVQQAKRPKGVQPPVLSERMFSEAVLNLTPTGIPLRDLSGEFGSRDAVYIRKNIACPLCPSPLRSSFRREII